MNELLLQLLPTRVEYACLFLTRVLALFAAAPFFATATAWGGARVLFALAVTAVLLPAIGDASWSGPALGVALLPLVVREIVVGTFLGLTIAAAFAAVRAAGELISHEMGLNLASVLDPATNTSTPVVGMLYQTCAGLLFFAAGGHRWVVAGLAHSFRRVPVGAFELTSDPVGGFIALLRHLFEAALLLGGPVMVAMFLVTVALGLLSRAVPQLNILDVGYALRVATALGALILLLPAFRVGCETIFSGLRESLLSGGAFAPR